MNTENPVGAGLARESGVSRPADAECADAFAGKPGSYRICGKSEFLGLTKSL
jgi:hypothetical protein